MENTPASRTELQISGMTCAACAARLEKVLNRMPEVSAAVNFATEKAQINFNPQSATIQSLIATVQRAGFDAHTVRNYAAEKQERAAAYLHSDRLAGVQGAMREIAVEHAARNLGRNGVTVSALMVGLAIMIGVLIMVRSFRHTVEVWINETVIADIVVAPSTWLREANSGSGAKSLPAGWREVLAAIPGVAEVDTYRDVRVEVKGQRVAIVSRDLRLHARRSQYLVRQGNSTDLLNQAVDNGGIIVSEVLANRLGVREGQSLEALPHPSITTDYSEALLEFIAGASADLAQTLGELDSIHRFGYPHIGDELLWTSSMPCVLGRDEDIPVPRYGSSNVARMKTVYRIGLGHRYGRLMQTIAGIHFNFSLDDAFRDWLRDETRSPLGRRNSRPNSISP